MNRIPRKRLVTLMAAAAGVTAGLASMSEPAQAQARTPASATVAPDTLPKSKPAASAKSGATAEAKPATGAAAKGKAATAAPAKKAAAGAKPVVSTAPPALLSENDACADEADCRNINGGGN